VPPIFSGMDFIQSLQFQTFQPFNRYAPFKPLPLSSPASRGRMKEGV